MATLTVEFPEVTELPEELKSDPERARYLLVGTMLAQGGISERRACALTGDAPDDLRVKLKSYGFSNSDPHPRAPKTSHWKTVAERFDAEGFLDERSGAALKLLAESRLAL